MRVVHFASSRALRKEIAEDTSETNSDTVSQGLHAPYTRFTPSSPLRMAASKLFAEKLEKSTFFVYVSLSR